MELNSQIQQVTSHLFRHESGKMCAVLVKLFGLHEVQTAEDIVQETLIAAFETWKIHGIPDNPRAWMYRVAKHKTIDFLRRERSFQTIIGPEIAYELTQEQSENKWLDTFFLIHEIEDAQLRMIFACCHPELPVEQQIALILKTLCGLSTKEIAASFLIAEETISKRIFRAKEKIRQAKFALEVPTGDQILPRLDTVLHVIYLLFNEGYKSSFENNVIRRDLCGESMRLCALLVENSAGNQPKTHALLALICFQSARFEARLNDFGAIVLLENQDRSLWNHRLITLGYKHFKLSNKGTELSEYHLEAAIASYHSAAATFETTNFQAIFYCYDLLYQMNPSPILALNRAIALGYAEGPKAGIEALLKIMELSTNHLYHTALGDFYKKNREYSDAKSCYNRALGFASLSAEKEVLESKLRSLEM